MHEENHPEMNDATAAILHGPKDVRIERRPIPQPASGEVLVEIGAVGLCGSDLHYYAHGENGPNVLRSPTALGHEAAGTVVAGDGPCPRAPGSRSSPPSRADAAAPAARAATTSAPTAAASAPRPPTAL
ncbi:alcohol dehydrogenase catalytic domain-containing protein [Streptomyces sp. NPDC059474]|uniref:alcohol dehydrogenase catalytic domain-containing protein n=1 Tax=Streptomyces sp. NPDC059474 TaxID=3346846 RepID=UPI00368155C4